MSAQCAGDVGNGEVGNDEHNAGRGGRDRRERAALRHDGAVPKPE
jgi:hypothetical protein